MTKPLLDDAFGHHVWATLTLLDVCLELSPDQLERRSQGRTARSSIRNATWSVPVKFGGAKPPAL